MSQCPNIVLICLNEWRHDAAGFAGDPNARTPNLNAIAGNGLHLSDYRVPTLDAQRNREALLPAFHDARDAGYDTMAVGPWGDCKALALTANVDPAPIPVFSPLDSAGFGAGRFDGPEDAHPSAINTMQALRMLRSATEPFFLGLAFESPGALLTPPTPWDTSLDPELLTLPERFRLPARAATEKYAVDFSQMTEPRFRKALARYYGMLEFLDQQAGKLLGTLSSRSFGATVLCVTGALGHYLGEDGRTLPEAQPSPDGPLRRTPLLLAGAAPVKDICSTSDLVELFARVIRY